MTEEERTPRRTQFDIGYETARKHALLVLSLIADNFPNAPSPQTLSLIGDADPNLDGISVTIYRVMSEFAKKTAKLAKKDAA